MPVLELTDNLQPKDKFQPAKLKAELATLGEQDLKDLQFIESCTLSDLQKESTSFILVILLIRKIEKLLRLSVVTMTIRISSRFMAHRTITAYSPTIWWALLDAMTSASPFALALPKRAAVITFCTT